MLIATFATGLRRVTRVNFDHLNTPFLSLVADQAIQLRKRPTVQASFVLNVLVAFPSAHLGGGSDIGEIFEDEGAAWWSILNNAFGEDMITIPVEALLLFAQLFQVAFSGLCSFGLQFSFEAEPTTINFFPLPLPEK